MGPVRLDEVRKPAGTANTRYGRDFFLPHFAFLNELEIKRENREITTTGTPGWVVSRDFFLGQAFALGRNRRSSGVRRVGTRGFNCRGTHAGIISLESTGLQV